MKGIHRSPVDFHHKGPLTLITINLHVLRELCCGILGDLVTKNIITPNKMLVFIPFPRTISREINTLRPRQNWRHFADDTFKRIFMNENVKISINISLKFVPKGLINNILALVLIMAWRRPGDKPLSEPMMVNLPTHICVIRPQWVNPEVINDKL